MPARVLVAVAPLMTGGASHAPDRVIAQPTRHASAHARGAAGSAAPVGGPAVTRREVMARTPRPAVSRVVQGEIRSQPRSVRVHLHGGAATLGARFVVWGRPAHTLAAFLLGRPSQTADGRVPASMVCQL